MVDMILINILAAVFGTGLWRHSSMLAIRALQFVLAVVTKLTQLCENEMNKPEAEGSFSALRRKRSGSATWISSSREISKMYGD